MRCRSRDESPPTVHDIMTTKITLTAQSYFGGAATVEFREDGCTLLEDTRAVNDGYLHLTDEQMDMPEPSPALREVIARYYAQSEAVRREMLGLPPRTPSDWMESRKDGFIRPPAGGATLCRWAFGSLTPDAVAKLAGLEKAPALA